MTQWTPITGLKTYGKVLARKMLFIAIAWIAVYWISQPFRSAGDLNVLMLFAPVIGAFAGLVAGWYMATDAVEDSSLNGLFLWIILVLGAVLPMWIIEAIFHWILPNRTFGFGGWMLLMSATILALAAAVWHASSQE
jgi:hypothetical protein